MYDDIQSAVRPPVQQPMPQPPMMPNMPPMKPNMPAMPKHPCYMPEMAGGAEEYMNMYPDIYYKLQPHVSMACDEMEMYGAAMPSKKMLACMCDRILENAGRMYPEMENFSGSWYAAPSTMEMDPMMPFSRGPVRDIVSILLLSELFRRRRFFF